METKEALANEGLLVRDACFAYGTTSILRGVSFDLALGETLVILGESGCGKTTLLRLIAGLIPAQAGSFVLAGRSLHGVSAQNRSVVYLDQEPLLFEHLNVFENIAFAPRMRQTPSAEVKHFVEEMLAAIDLVQHQQKRDWELSGGQKQRVAFARAVLARPQLMLLDEPFCSLDSKTRQQMQELFAKVCKHYGLTSIFVTHDVKEALVLGSRFARMSQGVLQMYESREAFMKDEATGVPAEMEFWHRRSLDLQNGATSEG
ncbi:MAG: ABC transporter ATP-binding protein [Planctomycetaceae bacterium]